MKFVKILIAIFFLAMFTMGLFLTEQARGLGRVADVKSYAQSLQSSAVTEEELLALLLAKGFVLDSSVASGFSGTHESEPVWLRFEAKTIFTKYRLYARIDKGSSGAVLTLIDQDVKF